MAKRIPQPFRREQTRCFYVQIGPKQHRLAPDEAEAYRLYHELMVRPPEERAVAVVRPSEVQAAEILDLFLGWCRKNRAEATYDWSRHFCQKLTSTLPPALLLDDLKHLRQMKDRYGEDF